MSPLRYLNLCFIASLVPLLPTLNRVHDTGDFPGWPSEFAGRPLQQLPLTEREKGFYASFPGRTGRFSDGRREIILRWVKAPTRRLHPAADCFRGSGYRIDPEPVLIDEQGQTWGSFSARHNNRHILVREAIVDQHGRRWTDVSAWYWSALIAPAHHRWWAITIAEKRGQTPFTKTREISDSKKGV